MKFELLILTITGFVLLNTYFEGKLISKLKHYEKYYKMALIAFIGLCIYLFIKKNPANYKDFVHNTNGYIKYLPIDRNSMDMLSPIIDFTGTPDSSFMESFNGIAPQTTGFCSEQKVLTSGRGSTKRSVSETKKKYIASSQDWKCGNCRNQLDHTFEIDHKVRLEQGEGNDVQNLIALCRNCQGKKTASENM